MKKIVFLFSVCLFCFTLSACSFTQTKVLYSKEEKAYIEELKKQGLGLDCMPKTDADPDVIKSNLCRKAAINQIGIEVTY